MLNVETSMATADAPKELDTDYPALRHEQTPMPATAGVLHRTSRQDRVGRRHSAIDDGPPAAVDPWARTVVALSMFSNPPRELPSESSFSDLHARRIRPRAVNQQSPSFSLAVLEHVANSLVVISWHDPTLCNYEEQVWSPALARCSGRCALSGLRIVRGDPVYKPRTRGCVTPLNRHAMILSTELLKARIERAK